MAALTDSTASAGRVENPLVNYIQTQEQTALPGRTVNWISALSFATGAALMIFKKSIKEQLRLVFDTVPKDTFKSKYISTFGKILASLAFVVTLWQASRIRAAAQSSFQNIGAKAGAEGATLPEQILTAVSLGEKATVEQVAQAYKDLAEYQKTNTAFRAALVQALGLSGTPEDKDINQAITQLKENRVAYAGLRDRLIAELALTAAGGEAAEADLPAVADEQILGAVTTLKGDSQSYKALRNRLIAELGFTASTADVSAPVTDEKIGGAVQAQRAVQQAYTTLKTFVCVQLGIAGDVSKVGDQTIQTTMQQKALQAGEDATFVRSVRSTLQMQSDALSTVLSRIGDLAKPAASNTVARREGSQSNQGWSLLGALTRIAGGDQ